MSMSQSNILYVTKVNTTPKHIPSSVHMSCSCFPGKMERITTVTLCDLLKDKQITREQVPIYHGNNTYSSPGTNCPFTQGNVHTYTPL